VSSCAPAAVPWAREKQAHRKTNIRRFTDWLRVSGMKPSSVHLRTTIEYFVEFSSV
jgi:hypothetical protein